MAEEKKRKNFWLFVLVGVSVYVLFAIMVVPALMRDVPHEPAAPDPTDITPMEGEIIQPMNIQDALQVNEEVLQTGQTLYVDLCAGCHGNKGLGDGPAGGALDPKPRNFSSPEKWTKGYTKTEIFRTLTEGIPGTSMAGFDYLKPQERFALVHFVQSLGEFDHGKEDRAAIEALDIDYSLSKGGKTPNKVPVKVIMAIEIKENKPAADPVLPNDGDIASILIDKLVINKTKAAKLLNERREWMNSPETLASTLIEGAPYNGFSTASVGLSAEQWKTVYNKLTAIY